MNNEFMDSEYIILENIYDNSFRNISLRQRELAQIAGTSLGMTNSILKRLVRKGWITMRKINSRRIQYAVSPEGINEIVRRSYRYFKRTIRNVVFYKERLDEIILKAKERSITTLLLAGSSDLDFILEHICHRYGLGFLKTGEAGPFPDIPEEHVFRVFAENIPDRSFFNQKNVFYLSRMVIKKTAKDV
ncbi:MAG: winged helix-turn-helix transcriptional regulator [Treponema sp.]|jgi:DNA-binding MarR family transcriptional regulator|nr:winged helix-turn-helix transcriptional regulator [Treponema sp.]